MNTLETKAASAPARTPANQTRNDGKRLILSHTQGKTELPQFLRDMIASPPLAGDGFHKWMFSIARQLHAHRDTETIVAMLEAIAADCGRHVPEREIRAAVDDASECAWQRSDGGGKARVATAAPKWPERDTERIRAIAEADPDALALLRKSSPVQITEELHDADCLLERLFPDNPLLCVGYSNSAFTTKPLESLRGRLHEMELIVPSPMTALKGLKKNPKPGDDPLSAHTLDNTGPRHYLVTECDGGDHATQAAVIRHLSAMAPLVMVVDSAGKSLHAWWRCKGLNEERLRRFLHMAVSLGADDATWTRSQFVRMPLGWRHEKAKRQQVVYFDYMATVKGGAA